MPTGRAGSRSRGEERDRRDKGGSALAHYIAAQRATERGVGQIIKTTLPDASIITYTYDDAYRLTNVKGRVGNRIAYALNLMGGPGQ